MTMKYPESMPRISGIPCVVSTPLLKTGSVRLHSVEAPKETPEKYKGLRQLLGTVVAELAVVAILI